MTSFSKAFVSDVFAAAAEQLAVIGFQKRRADIYTSTLNEEVVGWLGLGKHPEAETFIAATLGKIGNRSDEAAEWFRRFATKLREG